MMDTPFHTIGHQRMAMAGSFFYGSTQRSQNEKDDQLRKATLRNKKEALLQESDKTQASGKSFMA